ncbi:hypothetical protein [Nannocystis sp.]|uniref:hypothetical protein n=1 Tax=Nannocystis sp. TaxID=1962667 RepID=UPI0024261D8D|nr:hypothetical protein [Nannocystis sp.]MBK7830269.1 hypothetical protein [Nannocystis sp.]MBK9752239.1 hypothetical protein [Nannocystis sp.]
MRSAPQRMHALRLAACLLLLGCRSETIVKHDVSDLACPDPDTQYRDIDGYCVCDPEFGRYDPETDMCEDCDTECEGKPCGPDGCNGACVCEPGTVCHAGVCEAPSSSSTGP